MNAAPGQPSKNRSDVQVLVIDENHALSTYVRFCINLRWQDMRIVPYSAGRGLPPRDFDWNTFGLVIIRNELGKGLATGRDWAQALKLRRPSLPVILVTGSGGSDFVRRVGLNEVDLCLDLLETPPRLLNDAVAKILGEPVQGTKEIVSDHTVTLKTRRLTAVAVEKPLVDDGTPRVPGYLNVRSLTNGGMGTIVLAKRLEDDREVILKFLSAKAITENELLQRFMREYEVIGRLQNPHVVHVFERGFASDFAYISMEYLPAGDLRERLGAAMPPERALGFLRQMASGLGAAHDVGIVHRDLKPGNILFRDQASLAISDFGIAKDLTMIRAVTLPGSFLGTPYYSSPEQLLGRPVDRRSDLYSLGVMLFQMLTGSRPYEGQSTTELAEAHVNGSIPKLPAGLRTYQSLIEGMLAKDPDDRFQTTTELLAGLDWCAGRAESALST